jgi:dinuclear metal center YbgI/SA1388 family protein
MNIAQVTAALSEIAHLHYAEDFDNVGLLTGESHWEVSGVLVSLDCLEQTVDEAISKNCNLIVAFHPIIFKGLKNLLPDDYVKRTVVKAIKNDIAIYAIHTALDNAYNGVSYRMAGAIGLENVRTLIPQKNMIKKLQCYVPEDHLEVVREALFAVGAGKLGNYSECSYNAEGIGTFKGNDYSNPQLGEKNKRESANEKMLIVTYLPHLERKVLKAMNDAHPYEEVAHEVTTLENSYQNIGMGAVGHLDTPIEIDDFLKLIKQVFDSGVVRHTLSRKRNIQKVALLGGSGAFGIKNAIAAGADAYVTADLKYHDFFQGDDILLCDVGHFESERFTIDLLHDFLSSKFRNIAIFCAEAQTNPVNYY